MTAAADTFTCREGHWHDGPGADGVMCPDAAAITATVAPDLFPQIAKATFSDGREAFRGYCGEWESYDSRGRLRAIPAALVPIAEDAYYAALNARYGNEPDESDGYDVGWNTAGDHPDN